MRLKIHEEAAAEIQRHYEWYERRDPRVAARLAELFEAKAVQIATGPLRFPLIEMSNNPGNIRRERLKGFPLYILYRVLENDVQIIAVPHTSQQPEYWKPRLS